MSTGTGHSPQDAAPGRRRYELDWLRTLVVLGVIPFHALVIFGASSAVFIKSAESVPILALVGGFVLTWGIPLIFLMAGAASRLALERRTTGSYIQERLGRLLAPMMLVALVLSPIAIYFVLLSNPSLASTSPVPIPQPERLANFGEFYRAYLTLLGSSVREFSLAAGALVLTHLWFVPRLLIVSLLALPVVLFARRHAARLSGPAAWLDGHPALLLIGGGAAIALVAALLRPGWLDRLTARWMIAGVWWEFFLDFALFLCGYLIYARPRLAAGVRDLRGLTLGAGLACLVGLASVSAAGKVPPSTSFAPASIAFSIGLALSAWLMSLALLGMAMRYFTFSTAPQRYLTYATFPVFVLHLPILTIVAYYLVKVPLPWYIQFLLITAATMLIAFGIFELVIRRTPVTRFLFGVKGDWPRQQREREAPAAPPPRDQTPPARQTRTPLPA
jgi:glucan biosynthesis protein C